MSVTTTENPIYQTVAQVLVDYDIHHSGQPDHPAEASAVEVNPRSQGQETRAIPNNWPSDYRRVPPYRPIDRNLDLSQRPLGSNRIETAFITVMFTGVYLNAVSFDR